MKWWEWGGWDCKPMFVSLPKCALRSNLIIYHNSIIPSPATSPLHCHCRSSVFKVRPPRFISAHHNKVAFLLHLTEVWNSNHPLSNSTKRGHFRLCKSFINLSVIFAQIIEAVFLQSQLTSALSCPVAHQLQLSPHTSTLDLWNIH